MEKSIEKLTIETDWTVSEDQQSEHENLVLSCFMRIATATEAMAKQKQELINERDNFKAWYEHQRNKHESAARTINTLKGHLTRAKNRIKELEALLAQKDAPTETKI